MEGNDESLDLLKLLFDEIKTTSEPKGFQDTFSSALAFAILRGREAVVQWLTQSGAHLGSASVFNDPEHPPLTPLFRTVYSDRLSLTRVLLESKADPNAETGDLSGLKALHAAYDYVEITRLLIALNADISIKRLTLENSTFLGLRKRMLRHRGRFISECMASI